MTTDGLIDGKLLFDCGRGICFSSSSTFYSLSFVIEGLGLIGTARNLTRAGGPADNRLVEGQYRTTVSER